MVSQDKRHLFVTPRILNRGLGTSAVPPWCHLPFKGVHDGLMCGVEPLAGHHIAERLPDGLDPLVLVLLRPGEEVVGVRVLLVDEHEAVGPARVPREAARGHVLHLVILHLQALLEAVVVAARLLADQHHLVEDKDVADFRLVRRVVRLNLQLRVFPDNSRMLSFTYIKIIVVTNRLFDLLSTVLWIRIRWIRN